jgi:hypothetical protein
MNLVYTYNCLKIIYNNHIIAYLSPGLFYFMEWLVHIDGSVSFSVFWHFKIRGNPQFVVYSLWIIKSPQIIDLRGLILQAPHTHTHTQSHPHPHSHSCLHVVPPGIELIFKQKTLGLCNDWITSGFEPDYNSCK